MSDNPNKPRVFNDPKIARVMASQFYIVKELERNPSKAIKFMLDNEEYFPNYKSLISQIMKEKDLTKEDIDKESKVVFADLHFEEKRFEKLKKEGKHIHALRKEDHKKRNFRGNINSTNEYNNEEDGLAKLSVNLKEESFTPNQVKVKGEWKSIDELI